MLHGLFLSLLLSADSAEEADFAPINRGPFFQAGVSTQRKYRPEDIALGDIDGDGDIDIVGAHSSAGVRFYLNDGKGAFGEDHPMNKDPMVAESIALGDIDADGDLDVIVGQGGQSIVVYYNAGKGDFSSNSKFSAESFYALSIALADIDSDSDLDLLVLGQGRQIALFRNNGQGIFSATSEAIGTESVHALTMALGDIDNDNDIDLISGNRGSISFYFNDGDGTFKNVMQNLSDEYYARKTLLVDIDGDADLDLYVGDLQREEFYTNDGHGGFSISNINLEHSNDTKGNAVFGDVDGDGDFDMVTAQVELSHQLYLNNGKGQFDHSPLDQLGETHRTACCLTLVDLNGDQALDYFSASSAHHPEHVYINKGGMKPRVFMPNLLTVTPIRENISADSLPGYSNVFKSQSNLFTEQKVSNMAWADFDLDGDPDVVLGIAKNDGPSLTFYRNDSELVFTAYATFQLPAGELRTILFEDIDGDQYPDLVLGRFRQANSIHRNDGSGGFETNAVMLGLREDATTGMTSSDIDKDGDKDIIVSNHGKTKRYLNDGNGGFSVGRSINREDIAVDHIVSADINRDGHIDLVSGNRNGDIILYANHGDGSFDADGIKINRGSGGTVVSLSVGDVDRDNDIDIVVGGSGLRFFRNQGDGQFDKAISLEGGANVILGDVDLDGDVDIISSDRSSPLRLIFNNGRGEWIPADTLINSSSARLITLQDVDSDNDLDLLAIPSDGGYGIVTYLNTTHVSKSGAPPQAVETVVASAKPATNRADGFLTAKTLQLIAIFVLGFYVIFRLRRRTTD